MTPPSSTARPPSALRGPAAESGPPAGTSLPDAGTALELTHCHSRRSHRTPPGCYQRATVANRVATLASHTKPIKQKRMLRTSGPWFVFALKLSAIYTSFGAMGHQCFREKRIMKRTITAGVSIALAALLLPALGASASTQDAAQEPIPAHVTSSSATQKASAQQYSWATGFDSGSAGPSWMQGVSLSRARA